LSERRLNCQRLLYIGWGLTPSSLPTNAVVTPCYAQRLTVSRRNASV